MAYDILQSSTQAPLLFFMTATSDHIAGKTGLTPTVTIRKPGGAFASPAGAVTEIANGWYQVAGNATDTNTLGPLALHATGTDADPCDLIVANIVAYNPQAATPDVNVTQWLGSAVATPTVNGVPEVDITHIKGAASAGAAGYAGIDWSQINAPTTVQNLSGTNIDSDQVVASVTGPVGSVNGNVGGNVSGSVGSVVGNVGGSVVGSVASVTGNVGGNVAGSVGSVTGNVGGNLAGDVQGNVDGSVASVTDPVSILAGQLFIKKNVAYPFFKFMMTDSTTHAPSTGLTVSATRAIDNGAFGACANAVTELAFGWYKIDLADTDVNGVDIALRFTAATADDKNFKIVTQE